MILIILDLQMKFPFRKRPESYSMLQLSTYLLHLTQPLAYPTYRDALIQRASVTMVIPGDLCGVFLLLARLNTSYNGPLSRSISFRSLRECLSAAERRPGPFLKGS